jgi:hypothetical protein
MSRDIFSKYFYSGSFSFVCYLNPQKKLVYKIQYIILSLAIYINTYR